MHLPISILILVPAFLPPKLRVVTLHLLQASLSTLILSSHI